MAKGRDRYEKITGGGVRTVVPGGSVSGGRSGAGFAPAQGLSSVLGRISDLAFSEGTRQSRIRGTVAGGADPRGVLQNLQGRDPATMSVGDAAAYEAAVSGLASEISVAAKREMQVQYRASVKSGLAPDAFAESLDAVNAGFSEALGLLDDASSRQLQVYLDDYRNAQVVNFSERFEKLQRREQRAKATLDLDFMNEGLEAVARSGGLQVDGVIQRELEAISGHLSLHGYNSEEVADIVSRSRQTAHIARVRGEFSRLSTLPEKALFIERFEASLTKTGGMSRGLPDKVAEGLLGSFRARLRSETRASKAGTKALETDINSAVKQALTGRVELSRRALLALRDRLSEYRADGIPEQEVEAIGASLKRADAIIGVMDNVRDDSGVELEAKVSELRDMIRSGQSSEQDLLDAMETRLSAMRTGLKTDALSWADSAGVIDLEPGIINEILSGSDSAAAIIESRVRDATYVSGYYSVPRQILTKEEASTLATALSEAPVEGQAVLLSSISSAFGGDTLAVLEQLSPNAPELAHIGGLMEGGALPEVIEAAFKGMVIKEGTEDRAIGELADMRDVRTEVLSGLQTTPGMIRMTDRLKSVADLIYLGRGGSERGRFDSNKYEQALQAAAGMREINGEQYGGIMEHEDRSIIIPSHLRPDDVENFFDDLKDAKELLRVAATQNAQGEIVPYDQLPKGVIDNQEVSARVIRKSGLVSIGDGLYRLMIGEHMLYAENGQPYLIDLKRLVSP